MFVAAMTRGIRSNNLQLCPSCTLNSTVFGISREIDRMPSNSPREISAPVIAVAAQTNAKVAKAVAGLQTQAGSIFGNMTVSIRSTGAAFIDPPE